MLCVTWPTQPHLTGPLASITHKDSQSISWPAVHTAIWHIRKWGAPSKVSSQEYWLRNRGWMQQLTKTEINKPDSLLLDFSYFSERSSGLKGPLGGLFPSAFPNVFCETCSFIQRCHTEKGNRVCDQINLSNITLHLALALPCPVQKH